MPIKKVHILEIFGDLTSEKETKCKHSHDHGFKKASLCRTLVNARDREGKSSIRYKP
jgi:hypothetical protein